MCFSLSVCLYLSLSCSLPLSVCLSLCVCRLISCLIICILCDMGAQLKWQAQYNLVAHLISIDRSIGSSGVWQVACGVWHVACHVAGGENNANQVDQCITLISTWNTNAELVEICQPASSRLTHWHNGGSHRNYITHTQRMPLAAADCIGKRNYN